MKTTNIHNGDTNVNVLESLRYNSLFSNQRFEIDSSKNNLNITELSALKHRNEIVPLDLINPQPIIKKLLNKPLMLLAITSTLASSTFFVSAILMGQLWPISFAIVFCIFGIGTFIASYKNRTTVYQYKFANAETILFTLSEAATEDKQVELFVNALNKRIIRLNKKGKNRKDTELKEEGIALLEITDDIEIYTQGKQSEYLKHLDFLFNHGIVDEILYKRLNNKINQKITDSENRFTSSEYDTFDDQTVPSNIINFPVNA